MSGRFQAARGRYPRSAAAPAATPRLRARHRRRRPLPAALPCLALLLLPGCGRRESEGIDSLLREGVYDAAIPVETLALAPRGFEDRFEAAGVIEAEEEVTVSAEIEGRVLRTLREIGDPVARGAVLATLDAAETRARVKRIEAQLAKARTQLEWARKDLDRQQRLFATEVTAERLLDDATRLVDTSEDEVAVAEADLELANVELDRHTIVAPIAGRVARRHVSTGEYVRAGSQLYDLVATDAVKFVFSVAERDVAAIQVEVPLEVRIDAHGGAAFAGRVKAIAPAGATQTRTFRVEVEIPNDAESELLPGMSGRTEVVRRRFDHVYLLPAEAVLNDDDGSFVYLAADEKAQRAEVEILSQVSDKAVVSAALGDRSECVILGQSALQDGAAIRVRRRHDTIPERVFD